MQSDHNNKRVQKILARARQEGNIVEKGHENVQLELWQLVMYILDGCKEKISVLL